MTVDCHSVLSGHLEVVLESAFADVLSLAFAHPETKKSNGVLSSRATSLVLRELDVGTSESNAPDGNTVEEDVPGVAYNDDSSESKNEDSVI